MKEGGREGGREGGGERTQETEGIRFCTVTDTTDCPDLQCICEVMTVFVRTRIYMYMYIHEGGCIRKS